MTVDENGLEVADALIDPITGSCARTGSAIVTPGCARPPRPARSNGSTKACAGSSWPARRSLSVEAAQAELDACVSDYNTNRPH
jgi:hypothetical protein